MFYINALGYFQQRANSYETTVAILYI